MAEPRPVRLDHCTWPEIAAYLGRDIGAEADASGDPPPKAAVTAGPEGSGGIFVPVGSTEQHGPMGLIGTDALCAEAIAMGAAKAADALVAPTLALTPAPFNTSFPGTLSVSERLFEALVREVLEGLTGQGFRMVYFLNGHGANLAPMQKVFAGRPAVRLKSWWDFEPVNALRRDHFGTWEGMHATPAEVAITQATTRIVPPGAAADPPEPLSEQYIRLHSGDRHGPPQVHRARFPDGRVGSHSALANPAIGNALLAAAVDAVAEDYRAALAAL